MKYNVTNSSAVNITVRDVINLLSERYTDKLLSNNIYNNLTVQDAADNYYRIVSLINTENDFALFDSKRGIVVVLEYYVSDYQSLLNLLLENGYRITYED